MLCSPAMRGSAMVSSLIDNIGEQYRSMKGAEYSGDRYFSRPNKSTIETTGPNALRAQVDRVIRESQGRPDLSHNDAVSLERDQNHGRWSQASLKPDLPGQPA